MRTIYEVTIMRLVLNFYDELIEDIFMWMIYPHILYFLPFSPQPMNKTRLEKPPPKSRPIGESTTSGTMRRRRRSRSTIGGQCRVSEHGIK